MKTQILKWDVTLQTLLVLLSLGFVLFPVLWYFLLAPLAVLWVYQLLSNGTHLLLNHKSVGYIGFRKVHLLGAVFYPVFLYLYMYKAPYMPVWVGTMVLFVIPPLVVGLYYYLCYSELNYLKHREFFILK